MSLRLLALALLVLACGLSLLMGARNLLNPPAAPAQAPVQSQTDPQTNSLDPFDCGDFTYQGDAQVWYDRDHTDPSDLDADNDAIACEALVSRSTLPLGGEGGLTTTAAPTTTPPPTTAPTTTTMDPGGLEPGSIPLLSGGEGTSEPRVGEPVEATEAAPGKEIPTPGSNNVGKPLINIGNPPDSDVRGGDQQKVSVCHKGKKTLTVGAPALGAHLGHGDTEGPCPTDAGGGGIGGQVKVSVCHKGKKTLTVGAPAKDAHLGHGDRPGAC